MHFGLILVFGMGMGVGVVVGDDPDLNYSFDSPNVRTVLFHKQDLSRNCWTRDELALLYTRRLMQEILPRKPPKDMTGLLDYFKFCLETVRSRTRSRRAHSLMAVALADALGGYLQGYGLPRAKQANYEGTSSYTVTQQLYELQEVIKKLLTTDGGGWTRARPVRRSPNIHTLYISGANQGDACKRLITGNDFMGSEGSKEESQEPVILLPFLDDTKHPNAIAIPFKDHNLYSLKGKASADILVKYYIQVMECLNQVGGGGGAGPADSPSSSEYFSRNFYKWIKDYVVPRLNDDTWYPGFGSVYRVIETIKKRDVDKSLEAVEPLNHTQVAAPKGFFPFACLSACRKDSILAFIVIIGILSYFGVQLVKAYTYICLPACCSRQHPSCCTGSCTTSVTGSQLITDDESGIVAFTFKSLEVEEKRQK